MSVLQPRVAADLETALRDRHERSGAPDHREASTQRIALSLAVAGGRIAAQADLVPGTRPESVVAFRDLLLRQCVTALRAIEAIDQYDLALHWAEAEREAAA